MKKESHPSQNNCHYKVLFAVNARSTDDPRHYSLLSKTTMSKIHVEHDSIISRINSEYHIQIHLQNYSLLNEYIPLKHQKLFHIYIYIYIYI